ncbi:gamma carbonic anhydrase family protein [Thermodesulfobacteriota bacterium]
MIREFSGKKPKIDPSAFVSEAAYVIGDVEIGENANVWPGAVVRGDFHKITIGYESSLEDNCVVHVGSRPLIMGHHVIVGHGAVVHGHRLGNHILIGNNATVLDNAEIGDFCIIGAGSLITPDTKIPSHSMTTGVPAEIKGRVSEEQIKWLKDGSALYTQLAREYKEQGL